MRDCYSFATFIFFDKNLQYFSVKLSENMKASSFKKMQKVGRYTLYENIVLNNKIWFVCVLELVTSWGKFNVSKKLNTDVTACFPLMLNSLKI